MCHDAWGGEASNVLRGEKQERRRQTKENGDEKRGRKKKRLLIKTCPADRLGLLGLSRLEAEHAEHRAGEIARATLVALALEIILD